MWCLGTSASLLMLTLTSHIFTESMIYKSFSTRTSPLGDPFGHWPRCSATTRPSTIRLWTVGGYEPRLPRPLTVTIGTLVAREARSHDDLPDDAAEASEANLLMVVDGL